MNKTWIVAQREFLTRVRKKTFLLTTILLPLLIFGFYAMIIYFSIKGADDYKIALVDKANIFNNTIPSSDKEIIFEFSKEDTAILNRKVAKGTIDGYLLIPENYKLLNNDTLELRSA